MTTKAAHDAKVDPRMARVRAAARAFNDGLATEGLLARLRVVKPLLAELEAAVVALPKEHEG